MRCVIVGSGALGSIFGSYLARAGNDVVLLARRSDYVDAIGRAGGVTLRSPGRSLDVVPVAVTTNAASLGVADVILVLTKSTSTREAGASVHAAVGPDTLVVTLQNGLGNDRVLAEIYPEGQIVRGTTTAGGVRRAPGVVDVTPATVGGTSRTALGIPLGGLRMNRLDALAEALSAAGLPAEIRADVEELTWSQLLIACPVSPLSALLRQRVSILLDDPECLTLVSGIFQEVLATAEAKGTRLDAGLAWQSARTAWLGTGAHIPSMTQDFVAGRAIEVDALCAEVVREGQRNGVKLPLLETVCRLLVAAARHRDTEIEADNVGSPT
jgi:2-dehydropantoate 2-reductase